MSTLNTEDLAVVHAYVERIVNSYDRRRRFKPIFDLMRTNMQANMERLETEMVFGTKMNSRMNTLKLEETLRTFPERLRESEAEYEKVLTAARRRTASLEMWLENLA